MHISYLQCMCSLHSIGGICILCRTIMVYISSLIGMKPRFIFCDIVMEFCRIAPYIVDHIAEKINA